MPGPGIRDDVWARSAGGARNRPRSRDRRREVGRVEGRGERGAGFLLVLSRQLPEAFVEQVREVIGYSPKGLGWYT